MHRDWRASIYHNIMHRKTISCRIMVGANSHSVRQSVTCPNGPPRNDSANSYERVAFFSCHRTRSDARPCWYAETPEPAQHWHSERRVMFHSSNVSTENTQTASGQSTESVYQPEPVCQRSTREKSRTINTKKCFNKKWLQWRLNVYDKPFLPWFEPC